MLINLFIKYMRYELNRSAHTVLSYNNDIRQFEAFLSHGSNGFDPKSVETNDVRAWMMHLSKNGVDPRSIRRKVQALRAFFKFLIKRGEVKVNPAEDIEMARMKKNLPSYMRQNIMDELLSAPVEKDDFESVRNRLIILMLYTTGIRRSELISLKDADVDTDSCELTVLGKRNKYRIVPFGQELKNEISCYRSLRDDVSGINPYNFFVRIGGEPLYPSLVYNIVHTQLASVGAADKMSPHVLRHTFASVMLNSGAELNSVKEILGHESLAATQIYTHITFSELKKNYKLAHPRAIKKGG